MFGKVKWYDVRKGYGIISGDDGKEVFVHRSAVPFWSIYLNKGDKVEYSLEPWQKGTKASSIKVL